MDKKSLLGFALGVVLATTLTASLIIFQILVPAQPAQIPKQSQVPATLEKFRAYGMAENWEGAFLIIEAGKDRGIWAKNGLDPEWIYNPPGSVFVVEGKKLVQSGVKIGLVVTTDSLLVRSDGVPIKIVAGQLGALTATKLYVKGDGTIRTVKDLDGKKIGFVTQNDYSYRYASWLSSKFGIKTDLIQVGNLTNRVVALKLGKIDAFWAAEGAPLRLVDSGELRILLRIADLQPKPIINNVVWATEDLIESNPDLVRRFVKATLESVKYLKDNPNYAAELYIKRSNAPKDLADKIVSQLIWSPDGRGEGGDLVLGAANHWQFNKESGSIPANIYIKIEDAVDLRFLP